MKSSRKQPKLSIEERLSALEEQAHTTHTLNSISNDLLDQIAGLVVARMAAQLAQQLQVPRVIAPGEVDVEVKAS